MPSGFERIVYSNQGQELKSNYKEFEETLFYVGDVSEKRIASFDISRARAERKIGTILTPVSVDPAKKVDSVVEIPDSIMACGTCERLADEEKMTNGVNQGNIRVGYTDGSKIMLCKEHFKSSEVELHEIPDVIGVKDTEEIFDKPPMPDVPRKEFGVVRDKRTGEEIDITEQWHKYTD